MTPVKYDICVVGLGYIGLPTAAIFAAHGKMVYGLEVNSSVVSTINSGKIHIVEPGLEDVVGEVIRSNNLVAGTSPVQADVFIIAVPTPFLAGVDNPTSDLSYVESACRAIAANVTSTCLVVLESTSPVGTTEKVKDWIDNERRERHLPTAFGAHYVHCPERILPGQMLKEIISNERLCGGLTKEAGARARDLYSIFCRGEIHQTDARTAEMVKLTENASRDTQIAFANELHLVCDRLGINVWNVIKLANRHPRVNILQPGPGVGGHCIAVDPWFIIEAAPDITSLMRTARVVNDAKPRWVLDLVRSSMGKYKTPIVACLGLTFKADVDDIRESPALHIAELLSKTPGIALLVNEPNIDQLPSALRLPNVRKVQAIEGILEANIVLLLVNHRQYRDIDRAILKTKTIIDTRGVWS